MGGLDGVFRNNSSVIMESKYGLAIAAARTAACLQVNLRLRSWFKVQGGLQLGYDQIPAKCQEAVEVALEVEVEAEEGDPVLVLCQTLASHTKRCKSPK